ncbi:MAG: glycosyltransferase family 39 protein [Bdellovibrionaceae bacterium]|nr:glycosyltransferase family 39 protein [Pseudobdellovibrionaceae bacterium]
MPKNLSRLWWYSLVVKLILSIFLPLFNDETYYLFWSKYLQLSYFDHPPFISWLYFLGLPFNDFLNLVRLPSIVLGHITLLVFIKIAQFYMDEQRLYWFFWLSLFMPFFGPASLISTPDLPLLFFWALSLLIIIRIFNGDNYWTQFVLLGLSLGLGFTSKYPMVLIAPIFFVALFLRGTKRFLGSYWNFLIMLSTFILGSLPVFWWNIANNFQSFRFQVEHGVGSKIWNPEWTVTYVLGQVFILFPIILIFSLRSKSRKPSFKIIKWAAWIPLVFFFLTSFKGRVEANWPLVAHPSMLILAVSSPRFSKKWLQIILFFWITIFCFFYINFFGHFLPIKKLEESKEFDAIIPYIQQYQPLYARTFQMASQLSFKTKKNIYKLKGMNRYDFFDQLAEAKPLGSTFYLATEQGDSLPQEWLDLGFHTTEILPISDRYFLWKVEK